MGLAEDLDKYVKDTFRLMWAKRNGQKVPETGDVKLGNDAVELDGTVLYADLAESTALVKGHADWFAAEVYKTYLYCAAKIIRDCGGVITAYDGDRVMAVFIGGRPNTDAAKAGLRINYAVQKVIQPAMNAQYPKNRYVIKQKVGIDRSSLFVARSGIRGSNDLVWVGEAPNNAAKMAALSTAYATYVSASVYDLLLEQSKLGGSQKKNMWTDLGSSVLGYRIYGSNWTWSF